MSECKISKAQFMNEISLGKSLNKISKEYDVSLSAVKNMAKKYNVKSNWSIRAEIGKLDNSFEVIDTKEKAYILGFALGDASINKLDYVSLAQSILDKDVVEWMAKYLKIEPVYDYRTNKEKRMFPKVMLSRKIKFITKHLGDRIKAERHFPRIRKDLEPYLVRGLFDADGCLCYGIRKDRNSFFQYVNITHHKKCLEGFQMFAYKQLNISSIVRQKTTENCFIWQTDKRDCVLRFLDYIYSDTEFMPMGRKFQKYIAMRLELGGFMGSKQ